MVIVLNVFSMLALCAVSLYLIVQLNRRSPPGSKPYWIGAMAFVLFARVLEPVFLGVAGFALPGQSASVKVAVLGLVMACLTAGLFEETGKYICLKARGARSHLDLPWLAKFAVGYALCEAVLLGLISHAQLLYFYSSPDVLQTLELDSSAQIVIQKQVAGLTEWTALFLLVERIFAIVVQVGLTVLGALAIARRQLAWLLAAIMIHALINIPAASYQYGFLDLLHGEVIYALLLLAMLWVLRVKGTLIYELVKLQFTSASFRS
jgi:uncharacterized membrane protein YhfC